MSDRIFYSWQSYCSSNINRNFIGDALEKALVEIAKDDKTTIVPVIDRDTLGAVGSPDISHAIFEKIDTASVFVCDVLIIDKTVKYHIPNQNGRAMSKAMEIFNGQGRGAELSSAKDTAMVCFVVSLNLLTMNAVQ